MVGDQWLVIDASVIMFLTEIVVTAFARLAQCIHCGPNSSSIITIRRR